MTVWGRRTNQGLLTEHIKKIGLARMARIYLGNQNMAKLGFEEVKG